MDTPPSWPALSVHERRALGVLVEKQKTTDTYPLTLNAVVTGCNQKSNRDPLLDLADDQVEAALTGLQKAGLVMRVISGRVDKWKHLLYDAWKVNGVELAVLTELLLRGPQTEGELRGRASRMEEIADLDALRAVLAPLKERGLVQYLTPEGRRGTVLTHGFHEPHELARLRDRHAGDADADEPPPRAANAPGLAEQLRDAQAQIAQLRQTVAALQSDVARLTESLGQVRKELGLPT